MHAIGEQSGGKRIAFEAFIAFAVKGECQRLGAINAPRARGA